MVTPVVQDAKSSQALVDQLDYLLAVWRRLKTEVAEMHRGEGVPLDVAFEQIRRQHRIPKKVA